MKCKTGGCYVHDGHGGHTGVGCGCDCHTPPRPPEGKLTHNPPWHCKHGRFTPDECSPFDAYRLSVTDTDGSEVMLAIIPESKENAEFICTAVNLHAQLVEALEAIVKIHHSDLYDGEYTSAVAKVLKKFEIEALLKESRGETK